MIDLKHDDQWYFTVRGYDSPNTNLTIGIYGLHGGPIVALHMACKCGCTIAHQDVDADYDEERGFFDNSSYRCVRCGESLDRYDIDSDCSVGALKRAIAIALFPTPLTAAHSAPGQFHQQQGGR